MWNLISMMGAIPEGATPTVRPGAAGFDQALAHVLAEWPTETVSPEGREVASKEPKSPSQEPDSAPDETSDAHATLGANLVAPGTVPQVLAADPSVAAIDEAGRLPASVAATERSTPANLSRPRLGSPETASATTGNQPLPKTAEPGGPAPSAIAPVTEPTSIGQPTRPATGPGIQQVAASMEPDSKSGPKERSLKLSEDVSVRRLPLNEAAPDEPVPATAHPSTTRVAEPKGAESDAQTGARAMPAPTTNADEPKIERAEKPTANEAAIPSSPVANREETPTPKEVATTIRPTQAIAHEDPLVARDAEVLSRLESEQETGAPKEPVKGDEPKPTIAVPAPAPGRPASPEGEGPRDHREAPTREGIVQIRERIEEMTLRRPQRMTIRLNPDSLGEITLTLKQAGTSLVADFAATDDRMRHALVEHRQALAASLELKQIQLQDFRVFEARPSQDTTSNLADRRSPQQEARDPRPTFSPMRRTDPEVIVTLSGRAWAPTGLDLWI